MSNYEKKLLGSLIALLVILLTAAVITRDWSDYRDQLRKLRDASKQQSEPVDTRPLDTAQQLAPLAVTPIEQQYAQEALRLGDHSVDLAFAAAMRDATQNPAPLTPETRRLSAQIDSGEAAVAADQNRIAQFTQALAKAAPNAKDGLQQLIGIAQAQLALDQDDLQDAQQQLTIAGGSKQVRIQALLDQHKVAETSSASLTSNPAASSLIERTQSANIAAQYRAWMSLHSKRALLVQAQNEALGRANALTAQRTALQNEVNEEEQQKKIIHPQEAGAASTASGAAAPEVSSSLDFLRHVTEDRKEIAEYDQHIQTEQQLAADYGTWVTFVGARQQSFLHRFLISLCWILLIAVLVLIANHWVQRFFARFAHERRQLHTIRALILFVLQAVGLLLILLILFGMPSNFATVLALVGAGLTVALKDFIVGFFGWFVLMGKDGIRPGDWVEISGVGGEVLKVGFLHTVVLETGNWTDAGHPTGRRVSFVNTFATEGHYFNFSTAGQWLWDEIEVQVPDGFEPYTTAENIRKIAIDETSENARLAEAEWNRVTPSYEKRSFSAAPSISVRPTGSGVNVMLRYITRAGQRYEVRAHLYHAIVDLLHGKAVPKAAAALPPQPVPDRA